MANTNPDFIVTRNTQNPSIGVMGFEWSLDSVEGVTIGGGMTINTNPVGTASLDDETWKTTYGSSMDAFLSLVDGAHIEQGVNDIASRFSSLPNANVILGQLPNAFNLNIYEKILDKQQVQYVASRGAAQHGINSVESYGATAEVRTIGLRMPNVVAGWGYDILMSTSFYDGEFGALSTYTSDNESKLNRANWRTGPIDLRWDNRRGVWAAWNDMIVDHDGMGMGTPVFGSNPDPSVGFPHSLTTWSDAFWVRQIVEPAELGNKTSELCTHLAHNWYDNDTGGAAALSTIFTIKVDALHAGLLEVTVGDESTKFGGVIDILDTAHFYKTAALDGPIAFSSNTTIGDCTLVGTMKFFNGEWCPSVIMTPVCDYMSEEIGILVVNDQITATSLVNLCNRVARYTSEWETAIDDFNFGIVGMAVDTEVGLDDAASAAAAYAAAAVGALETATSANMFQIIDLINAMMAGFTASLSEICGCVIAPPTLDFNPTPASIPGFSSPDFSIGAPTLSNPVIDCEECRPIILNTPCGTPITTSNGDPCNEGDIPEGFLPTSGGGCGS